MRRSARKEWGRVHVIVPDAGPDVDAGPRRPDALAAANTLTRSHPYGGQKPDRDPDAVGTSNHHKPTIPDCSGERDHAIGRGNDDGAGSRPNIDAPVPGSVGTARRPPRVDDRAMDWGRANHRDRRIRRRDRRRNDDRLGGVGAGGCWTPRSSEHQGHNSSPPGDDDQAVETPIFDRSCNTARV